MPSKFNNKAKSLIFLKTTKSGIVNAKDVPAKSLIAMELQGFQTKPAPPSVVQQSLSSSGPDLRQFPV